MKKMNVRMVEATGLSNLVNILQREEVWTIQTESSTTICGQTASGRILAVNTAEKIEDFSSSMYPFHATEEWEEERDARDDFLCEIVKKRIPVSSTMLFVENEDEPSEWFISTLGAEVAPRDNQFFGQPIAGFIWDKTVVLEQND